MTSGRRVDSTASRMSSTARSPASTSTPDAVYASRVVGAVPVSSATRRDRLFQHELAPRDVVRDGLGVVAVEAGEAEAVVRQVERSEDAPDGEIAERVRADEVPDLVLRHVRGDELR